MTALNIPSSSSFCVKTFFEGERIAAIGDFFTRPDFLPSGMAPGPSSRENDLLHWSKFEKAFGSIAEAVNDGRQVDLESHPFVFMRWKEKFFIERDAESCGLTIGGFYFLVLDRRTGEVEGYYFDPSSTPYQKVELKVHSASGFSFPAYDFA
eukprot:tig00000792_g4181.t1